MKTNNEQQQQQYYTAHSFHDGNGGLKNFERNDSVVYFCRNRKLRDDVYKAILLNSKDNTGKQGLKEEEQIYFEELKIKQAMKDDRRTVACNGILIDNKIYFNDKIIAETWQCHVCGAVFRVKVLDSKVNKNLLIKFLNDRNTNINYLCQYQYDSILGQEKLL